LRMSSFILQIESMERHAAIDIMATIPLLPTRPQ
jgi:hypothetical protein